MHHSEVHSYAAGSVQQSEEGTVNVEGQHNLQEAGRIQIQHSGPGLGQRTGQRAGNTDSNADMASPSPERTEFTELARQFQGVGRREAIAFGRAGE